jgi:UPF0755 protein
MNALRSLTARDGLIGLAALVVSAAVVAAAWAIASTPDSITGRQIPRSPFPTPGANVIYSIDEAQSAASIGADLEELGVIRSGRQFEVLVELMGVAGQLAAGDHLLPQGSATLTIIDRLIVREAGPSVRLTFPEGLRYEEMAEIAEEEGFCSREDFIAAVERAVPPPEIAATLPPGASLQGYLFPDTYELPVGATADDLVALMLETFLVRFDSELRAAATARGLTMHQAVTLASIIEREAVIAEERPLIAGVFFNRLENNDILGADPTVQYAVAELDPLSVQENGWWKRELTLEDLAIESPYNTRRFPGLPPGPITNPGLASLEAAVNPAETDYYYFVANAVAGDGSHVFAVTEAEHFANIATYQAQ